MKLATSLLLFVCAATVSVTIPLSLSGGRLTPTIAWLGILLGVIAAVAYWLTSVPTKARVKLGWPEILGCILFTGFALRSFCWLVFYNGDSINVLSPNNLGDLPLHLTYIRYLAKGAKFWPQDPIFSGIALHYPAGIDIFSALLKLVGCDDFHALIWVGLIASAITCYALLRWGRWFAVFGFLCNSGIAGWKFFHHFNFEFSDYQDAFDWKSIPLSMFVTQRGLLYSIPVGLLLLTTWRAQWFRKEDDPEPEIQIPAWVQIFLYGTMPLFHLHTFLFLSALLACWIVFNPRGTKCRMEALDLILWSILPATVCVSLVTGLFQHGHNAASILHLKAGWLQGDQEFWAYWFGNFGILLPAAICLLAWLIIQYRKSSRAQIAFAFVLPSILVFFVACFVMFAKWEWDNTKVMLWAYLGVLPFLHEALLQVPKLPGAVCRVGCYLLLFFSGFVSLIGGIDGSHTGYEIAKRSELEPVLFATEDISPDLIFAGYPTYNHPLLMSGCQLVEGYPGHLSSHGVDYEARDADVNDMMNGGAKWRQTAKTLGIRYLFWSPMEEQNYPASTEPWKDLPVEASGPWGTIYDLGDNRQPDSLPGLNNFKDFRD